MKKLVFAALIAVGGLAASVGASSAMAMAPAPVSHTGASADVQDVRWDKHHRHHHYRHHHYKMYPNKRYHRGEGKDLYFHHDPHSQYRREHRRIQ
ncbi:hypothetical protein [Labrys monachus]|uniref:Ni/Co efflux regulator RcnB n=1 Tax=Labrys monachus TaxID=217067 RepID=A0ABU0FF61_9HYPH|nr:hypothetical protein [Labrys monachus]MDQ0392670.1 Ni/Co efflux regulator RcnB [Labrys monachus]